MVDAGFSFISITEVPASIIHSLPSEDYESKFIALQRLLAKRIAGATRRPVTKVTGTWIRRDFEIRQW